MASTRTAEAGKSTSTRFNQYSLQMKKADKAIDLFADKNRLFSPAVAFHEAKHTRPFFIHTAFHASRQNNHTHTPTRPYGRGLVFCGTAVGVESIEASFSHAVSQRRASSRIMRMGVEGQSEGNDGPTKTNTTFYIGRLLCSTTSLASPSRWPYCRRCPRASWLPSG